MAESRTDKPDRAGAARGFTLIELSIVIVIIALLVSIGAVAAGKAIRSSRESAERLMLVSLRQGVEQFKQQFGFTPPLVNDDANPWPMGPVPAVGERQPVVRDSAFLRSENNPDQPRYSEYSLTYYLMGVLDGSDMANSGDTNPIDGIAGPGFTRPNEDGTFSRKGQAIAPFVDAGVRKRLVSDDDPAAPVRPYREKLVDRWYVPQAPGQRPIWPAIRYYRWLPKTDSSSKVVQYLVPRTVGDPNANSDLRKAVFAIVSLGPDGKTDAVGVGGYDKRPVPKVGSPVTGEVDATAIDPYSTRDNLVEPGQ